MTKPSPRNHRSQTEKLARVCREQRVPLTRQRKAIFEAIVGRKDHPTADQIYEDVSRRLPNVSRMTVYRVLDLLVRLDMITKVCHPGSAVRFDPTTERHHHLVCLRCNQLFDLQDPDLDNLGLPDTRRLGFRVADYSIQFKGLCSACQEATAGSSRREDSGRASAGRRRRS
jgi:Fur family peroxide stress response transcriptional regulator